MRKKTFNNNNNNNNNFKKTSSLPNHNYSSDDVIQIRKTIYGMNMASPSPSPSGQQVIHTQADYERGWSSPKTPYSMLSRDANNLQYNNFADRYGLSNTMKVDQSPVIDTRSRQFDVSINDNNNNLYNNTYNKNNNSHILESLSNMNKHSNTPFSSQSAYRSSPFNSNEGQIFQQNKQQQQQQQQQYHHHQQQQYHHHQQQQYQQPTSTIDHAKQAQSLTSFQPDDSAGIDQLADWISAVNNIKHTTPNFEYGMLSRENPFPTSTLSAALKPFLEDDHKVNATLIDKHTSPKRTANIVKEIFNPVEKNEHVADPVPDLTYESLNLNQYDTYSFAENNEKLQEGESELQDLAIESEAATETNFISSYCYYYDEDKKLKKMPHYVIHRIQLAHQEFEKYLAKGRTSTLNSLQKTLKQGADAHVDILKKTLEKREATLNNEKILKNLDESLVQLISKKLLSYTDRIFNHGNDNEETREPITDPDEFMSYLNNRVESTLLEIKSNALKELETDMLAVASSKLESVQKEVDERRKYWLKQIEKDVAAVHEMKRTQIQKEIDGHWKNRMKKFLGATAGEYNNNKEIDIEKESDILLARERKKMKKILGHMDHLFGKIDKASILCNAEEAIIKSKSFSTNDDNDDKPHIRVSKKIEKKEEALRVLRQMASIVEVSLNKQETLAKTILTETLELKAHLLK